MYSLEDILFFFRTVALKTPLAPSSFTSLLRAKNRHFIYSPNARVLRNKRYAPSHKHAHNRARARRVLLWSCERVFFLHSFWSVERERESLKRERRERFSAPIETRSLPEILRDARGLSFSSLSDFYLPRRREADAVIVPHGTRARQCVTRVRIIFFR